MRDQEMRDQEQTSTLIRKPSDARCEAVDQQLITGAIVNMICGDLKDDVAIDDAFRMRAKQS